ncbi:ABC transporter substrate-binding protein [Allorhizobium sp. BGMRC 0089]|uniref:ABC transporter substrate-binding protein n=1 Tax=Allorhizobium sonneratiae TaxID=2934936 RepID=UPI0020336A94|nr:ABC transporter substrate-binding protein [Allorhizobium sonneratiae]MCM2293900.1 ABC transporter substrate-binding protein [Allorhizobium sonneratiae]
MSRILSAIVVFLFTALAAGAQAAEGDREIFPALGAPQSARLVIHAATDLEAMRPLVRDFQETAPGIAVELRDFVTNDLFADVANACATGRDSADIILSSSVDQLVRLANDGCAVPHRSAETARVPEWANWRDEVYGFTFEPVVFVYDKRTVPPQDRPMSHEALVDLLRRKPADYRGRIGTYDISASGIGYLLAFYDSRQASTTYGRLIESVSRVEPVIRCCNGEVLDALASGRIRIAYNVLGSYAYAAMRANPNLGIIVPRDYALILSRGAMIPSTARNSDLGRRFLDYLLSPRSRALALRSSFFFSEDASLPKGVEGPEDLMESGIGRPIRIGPALLAAQDQLQRRNFIHDWRRLIDIEPAP